MRYTQITDDQVHTMLRDIGAGTIDDLFAPIPAKFRRTKPLDIPAGVSELEMLADAKVNMFLAEIENDRDPVSRWTNYNKALETKVFKPDVMGTRKG